MAVSARYWRLRATADSWVAAYAKNLHAYTIKGFVSQDATGTDIFLSKTAYATSSEFPAIYPPAKAVDGNDSVEWTSAYAPSTWQSWWVDLGSAYAIGSLQILSYYSATGRRWPREFSLDYGPDGLAWTELVSGIASANESGFQSYTDLQAGGGSIPVFFQHYAKLRR